jgi:hypothetical protein
MNTTHSPKSTAGLGSLTKVATAAVLAAGVGLAVIGLGTGMGGTANAAPPPTLLCPATAGAGLPGTVTAENFGNVGFVRVFDGPVFNGPDPANGPEIGAGDPDNGPVSVVWPDALGIHTITAAWYPPLFPPRPNTPLQASCPVQVDAQGTAAPAPPPQGGGGGVQPKPTPPYCPFPLAQCHGQGHQPQLAQ